MRAPCSTSANMACICCPSTGADIPLGRNDTLPDPPCPPCTCMRSLSMNRTFWLMCGLAGAASPLASVGNWAPSSAARRPPGPRSSCAHENACEERNRCKKLGGKDASDGSSRPLALLAALAAAILSPAVSVEPVLMPQCSRLIKELLACGRVTEEIENGDTSPGART